VVIDFIDRNMDEFGVEPVCCALAGHGLKIAPPCLLGH
jgi:hypothetical protein